MSSIPPTSSQIFSRFAAQKNVESSEEDEDDSPLLIESSDDEFSFDVKSQPLNKLSASNDKKEPDSPSKQIKKIVQESLLNGELLPKDLDSLDRGLQSFAKAYPDSPKRRLRANKINEILETIASTIPERHSSPAFHRSLTQVHDQRWSHHLIKTLKEMRFQHSVARKPNQVLPNAINMEHIVAGEILNKTGNKKYAVGFHFSPPASLQSSRIAVRQIHLKTGIMSGRVTFTGGSQDTGGFHKYSTFFPPSIRSEEEIISVIESGVKIANAGTKTLFLANQQPPFHFEMIQRDNTSITSAYPVFDFSRIRSGQNVEIASGITINPDELLLQFSQNRAKPVYGYSEFSYDTSQNRNILLDREIYDISTLCTGINKGVYVDVGTGFVMDSRLPRGVALYPTGASIERSTLDVVMGWDQQVHNSFSHEGFPQPSAQSSTEMLYSFQDSFLNPAVSTFPENNHSRGGWDVLSEQLRNSKKIEIEEEISKDGKDDSD